MKYAVIETSGNQFQVAEGQIIETEKVEGEKGLELTFDKVLMIVDGEEVSVGTPYLEGKKVLAQIEEQTKADKLYIYKYKSKSRYRRKAGHRQLKTKIKINKI
ncbi:50S ribosomal protein L21 [candidate division CPR3 bacterium GWF2_35_18]|uniref:Large ribosomal subunit protein bL21 n=1 Tax=candidate division CPR3 bacterium GW2011_GWF2_35_18 TaxID=1618350 RepID=A0A0G0ESF7_UNCC3|nr:MAG: 50S ribosomal protein L21 [candidate division CPR3 bacterium GW2011_GWF2_35_18]KKP86174.1 MAG: 50S ribosomal protein L21 [candidate division CPR3 bacterium GW2011_GWE2_35_7]OGB63473.1 MAG: 50S ribosomal protein L21 [candidate division CPR3 bacterium GWF2_35_18]OGB64782.1 MAG: 50S ribosomal protein L21 [candidate division CPR3 bacterium RIFOXYA2_FULL_35_13]OGB76916.1 MAG: 50S ribosomal protein L21 [candidate division CPR3 bacterium RIFOXYC2_FULL_35_7]OGB78337.1 MAG: 50S ribosomal protei